MAGLLETHVLRKSILIGTVPASSVLEPASPVSTVVWPALNAGFATAASPVLNAATPHNIYSCQKFFIYVKIMACYSYPDKTWIRSQWGRLQERTGALCLGIRIF